MRVTNNMLVNNLLRNVNRNMINMQKKQDQLSTGKRVSSPSDDPVAITKIMKYKTNINELKQYDKNTKDALSWTQTSELAISDITKALNRARELAVQGSNETNTAVERKNIAQEIEQLKEHIIGDANKTFAGKYIFSSYQTDKKLLNDDGTFNIDITGNEINNKPKTNYEVGVGEEIEITTNGLDLFGAVIEDNFFTQNIPSTESESIQSKKSIIKGTFNLELDYTGGTNFEVSVDGTTYTVDNTNLDGSSKAIEKSEILTRFRDADDGGTPAQKLSEVTDIFFDSNDELVIQVKTNENIDISTNFDDFNPEPVVVSSKGTFDLTNDYTTENLDVEFDDGTSIIYDVDESLLNGSTTTLTKSEVISAYENATNAGPPATTLSDYANVFFKSGELVIQPKAQGNITINQNNIVGAYEPEETTGRDAVEAQIIGETLITDSAVDEDNGNYDLLITYDNKVEKISVNMSGLNNANDLKIAIQGKVDEKFGSGKLDITVEDGKPIKVSGLGATNDGSISSLEIRTIQSKKPQIMEDLDNFIEALKNDDTKKINEFIGKVDIHLENINAERSAIGAKTNRLEMILSRINDDNINVTQLLSNNQDVDMAETIMLLKNAENVYKASLSAGARVIQPSLLDFLK